MTESALQRAIEIAGSSAELARRCNVTRASLQGWKSPGRVPAERVLAIEEAVDGKVTRHELRPDLYPQEQAA